MSASNVSRLSLETVKVPNRSKTIHRKASMPEESALGFSSMPRPRLTETAAERTALSRAALVQNFPLFFNIPFEECREIVAAAHQEDFARRQTIYLEGDPVRHIVLLISGCAKVSQIGQNGTEVILRLNSPGEMVGKVGCAQARHGSMAQALAPSSALVWDATVFENLSQRFPALRCNMLRTINERLERLEERFREISTERVAARLSREIVRLLAQVGHKVNGNIEINLSREELAQLIGTTLFTVSRLLSDWDSRGIVSTRREAVSVIDLHALQQLAECE